MPIISVPALIERDASHLTTSHRAVSGNAENGFTPPRKLELPNKTQRKQQIKTQSS